MTLEHRLQKQLDEMKAKVADMEAELNKPKKFELEYEEGEAYLVGYTSVESGCVGNSLDYLENGRYRQTKEGAELSLARQKKAARLEALVEQCGSIKEFSDGYDNNYYIYNRENEWHYSSTSCLPSREYLYESRNSI